MASHSGDKPRASTSTTAAPAAATTRGTAGRWARSSTSTSPAVHVQMAAAISRPLGFTTDPRNTARGVADSATATTSRRDRDHTEARARASPSNSEPISPPSSRIRYTATSVCETSVGSPTTA